MENIRNAVLPGQISSVDGEDIPTGDLPDHPEATPDVVEGERPSTEPDTELVLDIKPS